MAQPVLLGLDSTDAVDGGCTTHALVQVWRRLREFGAAGPPRLVRLNPNVPYKTRGNGALCVELGHGTGRRRVVGVAGGEELVAYERVEELASNEQEAAFRAAAEVVDGLRAPSSHTGLVALSRAPPSDFYEKAVRAHMEPHELPVVPGWVRSRGWNTARGLVGAFAAAAWPAAQGTYEAIAYRDPQRWGTPRRFERDLGPRLDKVPSTFDSWDPVHRHLRIAPRSPCPVLAGIRGTEPGPLIDALDACGPEPADAWMLFATNQATGDHLEAREGPRVRPFDSPLLCGMAVAGPETRRGGHVRLPIEAQGARFDAWAFEPTKEFRDVVREVRAGDDVLLEGAVHEDPRSLSLEALTFLAVSPERFVRAPVCRSCGSTTKAVGRRGGYRCEACGARGGQGVVVRRSRAFDVGRRTVPISVRRHLSRPNGVTPVALAWP